MRNQTLLKNAYFCKTRGNNHRAMIVVPVIDIYPKSKYAKFQVIPINTF